MDIVLSQYCMIHFKKSRLFVLICVLINVLALAVVMTSLWPDGQYVTSRDDDRLELANTTEGKFIRTGNQSAHDEMLTRDPLTEASTDPFASSFVPVLTIPARIEQKKESQVFPAPVAPSFPFRYLGRMIGVDKKSGIYLSQEDEVVPVQGGSVLSGVFRIDEIRETEIIATYLPLNHQYIVPIPPRS